jgi:branched-chain amino acid transport system ATP-binding protein
MSGELSVADLAVRYRKIEAVHGIALTARSGEITFVVGPNGAGKSSTMLAISGAVPASGEIEVGGESVTHLSATQRARFGISVVPEGRQIFPRLTVRQNLQVMAEVLRLGGDEVERALDRFPILRDRRKSLAGVLSGGEQQMLAVTRALMGRAQLLLLDEFTAGLAPVIVNDLMEQMRSLAADGITLVLCEPTLGPLTPYVDHGYVMLRGRVAAEADSGEALEAAYQEALGVGGTAQTGEPG